MCAMLVMMIMVVIMLVVVMIESMLPVVVMVVIMVLPMSLRKTRKNENGIWAGEIFVYLKTGRVGGWGKLQWPICLCVCVWQ